MRRKVDDHNEKVKRMIKFIKRVILVLILTLLSLSSDVHAAPDWQITIRVESGSAYNRLVLGADNSATNGYDTAWDSYALLGGQIETYFPHPEWGQIHVEYQRDIRAHSPVDSIEWPLTIESGLAAGSIFTVSWSFLNVPQDYQLMLINESNNDQIDLQLQSSYQFTYSGISSFRISVSESSSCLHQPTRILETAQEFSTLQEAYNNAAIGHTIQTHAVSLSQDMTINFDKPVSIRGGYDCNYQNVSGKTTLSGALTINSGSVQIENFMIE